MALGTPALSPGTSTAPDNVNIAQIGGSTFTLGQKTMANSVSVAIASDQSSIPITLGANQSVNVAQIAGNTTVTAGVNGLLAIGGGAATGANLSGNPVLIGGSDGTKARSINTDTSGNVFELPVNVEVNQSVTSATTIFTQDCVSPSPLRWVNLQLLSPVAWNGVTVTWEGSNDNATWSGVQLLQSFNSSTGPQINTTSTGSFNGPIPCRYFRVRVSGYTSGTVQCIAEFSSQPATPINLQVSATQAGSWTVTANAGTNLNTSALALESGGNLATLAGGVASSVYQANVKQVNGVTTQTGTGTAGTGTQRVAVASDSSITSNIGTTNGLALDATLTGGTQQAKITDGTNIANVLPATSVSNAVGSQAALLVAGAYATTSYSVTAPGATTAVDVSNYKYYSVHITSQYTTSTVNIQGSNDNLNWVGLTFLNIGSGALGTSQANVGNIMSGPIQFRYFRINITGAYTSGTAAGTIMFYTVPPTGLGIVAQQVGTWTVQPGNTANTTAWLMAGGKTNNNAAPGATNLGALSALANAAIPTWTEGNLVLQSVDLSGNQRTILLGGLMPTGTALNTYSIHLTTNTTTTPTSSTAYISCISISTEATGTTSTVTIQDKQGTPLKLVNGFSTTALTTTPTTVNFQTPVKMVSGIDIITGGAVAATVDVWIDYYQ